MHHELKQRLEELMRAHPRFTSHGMGIYRRLHPPLDDLDYRKARQELRSSLDDVAWTMEWLAKHFKRTKNINKDHTSYGLKHVVERTTMPHRYIGNGIFIAAAMLSGFKTKIYDDNLNVCFNISTGSINQARQQAVK